VNGCALAHAGHTHQAFQDLMKGFFC